MDVNEEEPEGQSEAARLLAELMADWTPGEVAGLPQRLDLKGITLIPALFQPRAMVDRHVSELRRVVKAGGEVDPVTMLRVGERCILIDGHHRHAAYRLEQRPDLPVVWFGGSPEDASLEAGMMNSKAKLPMTNAERQNYAWRLVLIDRHSKARIAEASGVAARTVATMRTVRKSLGTAAADQSTWWKARRAAQGSPKELDPEERRVWMEEQAERWADVMFRQFGSKMSGNPEIAALTLERYFGEQLDDVLFDMGYRRGDAEEEEF
ncbi:MAG: ParB/RepB/Spo0J family partition protein [Hoeflea sp.]|nr:ParB/RepB/Spo0J family partition protein [Hoeflea sp.]